VANVFGNFFITITEKNTHLTNTVRRCYFNNKRFISWKLHSIKTIPITEAEIKSIIHPLKPKKCFRI
jgi:hypothetical protein